jgi:hypothetical protein
MALKNNRLANVSRRAFLLTSASTLGCGRRRGTAFPGYAFVANAEGRSLAVVDLTIFSVARRIPLDASPTAVIAHPEHDVIYALTPANGTVVEVDGATLAIRRKLRLGAGAVGMRLAPDSLSLWVLCPSRGNWSARRLTASLPPSASGSLQCHGISMSPPIPPP